MATVTYPTTFPLGDFKIIGVPDANGLGYTYTPPNPNWRTPKYSMGGYIGYPPISYDLSGNSVQFERDPNGNVIVPKDVMDLIMEKLNG